MPTFRNSHDHATARTIERWKIYAREAIDTLATLREEPWRETFAVRGILTDQPGEPEPYNHDADKILYYGAHIIGVIASEFSNLNPKPIQDLSELVSCWASGDDLQGLPDAGAIRRTFDRAWEVVNAVEMAILRRVAPTMGLDIAATITKVEFARIAGLSTGYVSRLAKKGVPITKEEAEKRRGMKAAARRSIDREEKRHADRQEQALIRSTKRR